MGLRKIRWCVCAAVAFMMGIPFVEQAKAGFGFGDEGIVGASIALVGAIIGAAGDS